MWIYIAIIDSKYITYIILRASETEEKGVAESTLMSVDFEEGDSPIVVLDNKKDPFSTVLKISYGNRLGDL